MKSIQKLKWQSPNYFSLKDALIKSGTSYFPGVEGANICLTTPGFTGTIPAGYAAQPVSVTNFPYTSGVYCNIGGTKPGGILCADFQGDTPCSFNVQINYDISINRCSSCF